MQKRARNSPKDLVYRQESKRWKSLRNHLWFPFIVPLINYAQLDSAEGED